MNVNILGTIVSPDYDDEMFSSWIQKGVITPSSRVVAALEGADEPVDLYINSYGGDVFAGGEMLIAIQKCLARGLLGSVEVGSIAASMAANIVAALRAMGVEVVGHSNSQLMFHGCYTSTEGGAQHHEDVAESLRNINDAVVANLNRIGVKECRAWFAEGREKWMSADEANDLGLFTALADGEAINTNGAKRTASRLAAFASTIKGRLEYVMELDKSVNESQADEKTAEINAEAEKTPVEASVEAPAMIELAECEKRVAGLQAAKDKQISELTNRLAEAEAKVSAAESRADAAERELADIREQLAVEQKNHEAVAAAALGHVAKKANALEVLQSLPMSQREAFYKAHRDELINK